MEFTEKDLYQPTAVVCIDMWSTFNQSYNIKRFLNQKQHKMIVIANYSNPDERQYHSNIWYKKRHKIFKNNVHWLYMHTASIQHDRTRGNDRKTKEDLLTYYDKNQFLIGLYYTWEFLYILENYGQEIKNICFIGGNWEQCMIDRPLGWYKIGLHIPKTNYNIIAFAPLINKSFNVTIEQTPNWNRVNKDYFYYNNPNLTYADIEETIKEEKFGSYKSYSQNFVWEAPLLK